MGKGWKYNSPGVWAPVPDLSPAKLQKPVRTRLGLGECHNSIGHAKDVGSLDLTLESIKEPMEVLRTSVLNKLR